MSDRTYSVAIVLDRNYGDMLRELSQAGPVWVIDSATNTACARQNWAEHPGRTHHDGITVFKATEDRAPDQILLDNIDTIDLHHGPYSADPPYRSIRVIGTTLTPRARAGLENFGFGSFTETAEGFQAVLPSPPPDEAAKQASRI